jgi:hypothetical protein
MSGTGPPSYYDPNPGDLYASQEHHANRRLYEHGASEYDRQQAANRIGGMHALAQELDNQQAVYRLEMQQRAYQGLPPFPSAPVTPMAAPLPGAVTEPIIFPGFNGEFPRRALDAVAFEALLQHETRVQSRPAPAPKPTPMRQPQAAAPVAAYEPKTVYEPKPMVSRRVAVIAVAVVVLAIIGLYQLFSYDITLSEMGISDKTKVTWSQETDSYGNTYRVTSFDVHTTNDSSEEREVKFCAREHSNSKDTCVTYTVRPGRYTYGVMTRKTKLGREDEAPIGSNARIVEIDGHNVR